MEHILSIDEMEIIQKSLNTSVGLEEMNHNRSSYYLRSLDDLLSVFDFEIEKAKEQF